MTKKRKMIALCTIVPPNMADTMIPDVCFVEGDSA
jgi:hypothetical protein